MPFDPNVTFQDAEKAREARLSIGRQRRKPEMLGMVEELKNSREYHIFNVGPWPHIVRTGSTGEFMIPGCPEGTEYVEMLGTIPGIVDELIIKNESEYDRLMDDGWKFALEVVGDGRGRSSANSLRHVGVFPSKTAVPSPEEIAEARQLLHARCSEHVADMRNLFATNRDVFSKAVRPEIHHVSARILGLSNEDWMVKTTPQAQAKCPYCTTSVPENAIKCPNCKEVIDHERYEAMQKPRRGPGRPRSED